MRENKIFRCSHDETFFVNNFSFQIVSCVPLIIFFQIHSKCVYMCLNPIIYVRFSLREIKFPGEFSTSYSLFFAKRFTVPVSRTLMVNREICVTE